ncbi:MAG: hypothetical protein IJT58_02160 [Synergistaceae bacterium]|nr:hypothetical protein [Synergistaceae bacterium]
MRPCVESSRNFDTTATTLEALKILQKSYMKRGKMIYIDPPYNYRDDFPQPESESRQRAIFDEVRNEELHNQELQGERKEQSPLSFGLAEHVLPKAEDGAQPAER